MRTKVTILLLLLNAVLFYYIYTHGKVIPPETTTILGPEASNAFLPIRHHPGFQI